MRQVAVILTVLAAIAFLIGTYVAFSGQVVIGRQAIVFWRGSVGLLLFAITVLLLDKK